ncbi:hypothetical protein [Streptomyces yangpuensis]|uniref:hypothetical protein n=1 Tax=Streptomyces yangpuensis TaxID=1648182 RepID=UPI003661AEC1
MNGSGGNSPQALDDLRKALSAHDLVNLTGPLGVGKSHLAGHLDNTTRVDLDLPGTLSALRRTLTAAATDRRTLVIDSTDGRQRLEAVSTALDQPGDRLPAVVVVSRRPVTADPRWAHSPTATIALPPAGQEHITALAAAGAADTPALVARLAGGTPLLADTARRALTGSLPPTTPGALADRLAQEILERLGRELPGQRWQHALRTLATMRCADEELLPGGPDQFTRLAELSIIERSALGLRITEPYRTVLELAYQWRRPQAHQNTRLRARDYRLTRLGTARDSLERADHADHGLFLTGDPLLRRELFPAGEPAVSVRTACAADGDDIARLMHHWALHSGFDPRRCRRLTERWAADDISAFHLAHDRDGRPIGIASLMPIGAHTADSVEPLLQQHSGTLADGGLFLGAAHCHDPAARGHLLRHTLRQGIRAGRLVVSTASPDYQDLVRALGFRRHGATRDDVYRCGSNPQVFSNDLTAPALPDWFHRITTSTPHPPQAPHLSPQELQILLDYTSGLTLTSAARRAGITLNTAKDYLKRAKSKYRAAGRPAHTKIDLALRVREDQLDRP